MITKRGRIAFILACGLLLAAGGPGLAQYQVETRPGIAYADHDGAKLVGDLYRPKELAKAPVVVAMHGGGWQVGSRASYRYWGPFLARNGFALFSIEYRLGKPGVYPGAVYDAKAAVQYVRARATELGVDPERIAVMGDSAGGHLAALLGLAADQFASAYRSDPHADVPAGVKAVIGFYGVYDMLAQWMHDQTFRPNDQITEKFLGASPTHNRRIYFDASPLSYATVDRTRARFLLIHGDSDDVVDAQSQSAAFLAALNQARIYVRRIIVPGAGHFWASDPLEEPGSISASVAPRLLRFLQFAL
jgi:acetyl esterase/lipase